MSKLKPEALLDLAMEIRRGQKTMKDVDAKIRPDVEAKLRSPITMQLHARRREREANVVPSRFTRQRPERARFL